MIEAMGYTAAAIMAVSLTPQVVKSWVTKSTKDISILWTALYMLGLTFWIIYAYGLVIVPLFIAASLEFILLASLIVLKIRYG